ncbi:TatD family hydrolase [Bacteroidales bacterium OttesenSCG-928-C03]|nr:TatD family hydrolase [Bacteroidales bacterium OttesenSCG-928-C03]MDL2325499.1 TatD family hydrolase [Bacteroidales bacterium OttesenSCG-928-A14]
MYYTDTHAHIYREYYPEDFSEVVSRAIQANVNRIILPCVTSKNIPDMLAAKEAFPNNLFLLNGLHPTDVRKETYKDELAKLKYYLDDPRFIGIGEVGLDLYWDKETLSEQQKALHEQLSWAADFKLPVSMHVRDAYAETYEVLQDFRKDNLKVVMHCFSGGIQEAKWAVEHGFYLGIGGVVTFKNSKLQEIVKEAGLQHLVLETDAPFLAPAPFRGKRNESAYIPYIAQKLGEIFGTTVEKIAKTTTENAEKVFFSGIAIQEVAN